MPLSRINFLASALPVLLLAGCALHTPVPSLEPGDVPTTWVGPISDTAVTWPEQDWWSNFDNAELSSIVAQVQENNFDLENNERTLRNAQITLREAGFNLLPTPSLTLGTSARYSDVDGSSFSGIDDGFGGGFGDGGTGGSGGNGGNGSTGGLRGTGNNNEPFELGLSLSYNNILSRPATYQRAVADYESSVAQYASTNLNILGTAASTYFQLLFTRDQIEVAQQNVENAEVIAQIISAQVDAGVTVPINLLNQQITIETQLANLRNLIQRDLAARSALALLTGQSVQQFEVSGATLQDIVVPTVQPGLPSELLRRRPDLVQAEASLRAATSNVDLAYLNLFPQISLTGSASAASTSLSALVSSPDTFVSASASVVQTLLDNGQRLRNLEQQRLNLENALNNYRKAVIGAFNDIEVQLDNLASLRDQVDVAQRNLDAAEEAFRLAEVRYQEGVADFQTVLNSQDSLFQTRNAYLNTKLTQLNAVVDFYQALGGGWQADS